MALTRPLKEGSVTTYQEKVALGFKDILASEADGDHDTMYAAWNGALGGDLTGTLPNPTVVAAAKSKWTISGATLTPTDATKTITIGATAGPNDLTFGTRTIKHRLIAHGLGDGAYFASNIAMNAGSTAWIQDDVTKASWLLSLEAGGDKCTVTRAAPGGAGALAALLTLDNAGTLTVGASTTSGKLFLAPKCSLATTGGGATANADLAYNGDPAAPSYDQSLAGWLLRLGIGAGNDWATFYRRPATSATFTQQILYLDSAANLYIIGSIGQKASGTTWSNPSDIRLKKNVAKYTRGLSEILQLEPISYTLKQNDIDTCGFDAEKVRAIFPECVGTTKMKLDPDDEDETEVLTFDMHPVLVAVVNALKELAAKVGTS